MEQQQESKIRYCIYCKEHLPPQSTFCPKCGIPVSHAKTANTQTRQKQKVSHIFFSYARKDQALRDDLEEHLLILKHRGLITTWHAQEVSVGQNYIEHISAQLDQANIILLLISVHFLASRYCYETEMTRALERHSRKEADVIPILLRPVHFHGAPFSHLNMLPKNGKFVTKWSSRESAFQHIAEEIENLIINQQDDYRVYSSSVPFQSSYAISPPSTNALPVLPSSRAFRDRQVPLRGWPGFLGGSIFFLALLVLFYFYRSNIIHFFYTYGLLLALGLVGLLVFFGIVSLIIRVVRNARRRALQQREAARREEEARRRAAAYQEELQRREEARSQNYYRTALRTYQRALEKNPFDALAYRGLGNTYLGLHSYSEAQAAFLKALQFTPKQPACFVGLGDAYLGRELFSKALEAYEKALEIDPTYAATYAHLYDFFTQRGEPQKAREVAKRARQRGYEVEEETIGN